MTRVHESPRVVVGSQVLLTTASLTIRKNRDASTLKLIDFGNHAAYSSCTYSSCRTTLMMPPPLSPLRMVLLLFLVTVLLAVIQFGMITVAFDKLGLSPGSALALLLVSLIGSGINLPLFSLQSDVPPGAIPPRNVPRIFGFQPLPFTGKTLIAINVGGGVIPCAFSLYLFTHTSIALGTTLLATALIAALSYFTSRPIAGIGIGMPPLLAPVFAALLGLVLDPQHSAPLAYVCGTLGVLIGADFFRLKNIRSLGASIAAIGGAGTFDGVFITGIVAVLLA